jgi:Signal transduction histidine kinase
MISGRKRKAITFTVLGSCLVAAAVTLNISWLVLNWREGMLIVVGTIFFLVINAGVVVNTIFLVREIRRNEQHDSFINAVTHELKTPVASIRLYLQTLQSRELDEDKRREFYRIMLEDSDRLLHTIDQVLRAGATGSILRRSARMRIDLGQIAHECVELARTRFHLGPESLEYVQHTAHATVMGDSEELKAAVWNLLDNAVKYSQGEPRIVVELDEAHDNRVAIRVTDNGVGISPGGIETHLQTLLPHPGHRRGADQGQWPRLVHRPFGSAQARRPCVCAERRPRPGQHVYLAPACRAGIRVSPAWPNTC